MTKPINLTPLTISKQILSTHPFINSDSPRGKEKFFFSNISTVTSGLKIPLLLHKAILSKSTQSSHRASDTPAEKAGEWQPTCHVTV